MEPRLPFDFVVHGTALSLGASGDSRAIWKEHVRRAAARALPEGAWLLTGPLSVTIYLFPAGRMQGDVDNRVKPILDALVLCVYADDRQVERLVIQKFEPGRVFPFSSPSVALAEALEADEPVVYIRVSSDLHEDLS